MTSTEIKSGYIDSIISAIPQWFYLIKEQSGWFDLEEDSSNEFKVHVDFCMSQGMTVTQTVNYLMILDTPNLSIEEDKDTYTSLECQVIELVHDLMYFALDNQGFFETEEFYSMVEYGKEQGMTPSQIAKFISDVNIHLVQ